MTSGYMRCGKCGRLSFLPMNAKNLAGALCPTCKTDRLEPLPAYSPSPAEWPTPAAYVIPKATHKVQEIDQDMSGSIYVYLATAEHVSNWVNGGSSIPIQLANSYKANELKGSKTPDENLIHESDVDLNALRSVGIALEGTIRYSFIGHNSGPNGPIQNVSIQHARYEYEDGRVLCFSRTNSRKIANFLGTRQFCVRIDDIPRLKKLLDEQVGRESIAGHCDYTNDHQRNPFLKGKDQEFFDEFRIYWPNLVEEITFTLPEGIAVEVPIADPIPS